MLRPPALRRAGAIAAGVFGSIVVTGAVHAQTPSPSPSPSPVQSPGGPTGIPLAEVDANTALLLVVLGSIGVALIWLIPMLWDLTRSYKSLAEVRQQITTKFLSKATAEDLTTDELQVLLRELSRPPRGYPGLSRSLMAFVVITIVAVSQLGLSFFNIAGAEDLRKTIVNSLLAVFASIAGFYFGTRATQSSDKGEGSKAAASPPGRPVVKKVEPPSGPAGAAVTISGSGFSEATEVLFGKEPGVDAQAVDDSKITVKAPQGTGTVDVVVVASKASSARTLAARFRYAAAGPEKPAG